MLYTMDFTPIHIQMVNIEPQLTQIVNPGLFLGSSREPIPYTNNTLRLINGTPVDKFNLPFEDIYDNEARTLLIEKEAIKANMIHTQPIYHQLPALITDANLLQVLLGFLKNSNELFINPLTGQYDPLVDDRFKNKDNYEIILSFIPSIQQQQLQQLVDLIDSFIMNSLPDLPNNLVPAVKTQHRLTMISYEFTVYDLRYQQLLNNKY